MGLIDASSPMSLYEQIWASNGDSTLIDDSKTIKSKPNT